MTLEPGDTVGIIGGGQLGRMLAMSAAKLGLETLVLDPARNAPAGQCASGQILAAYDDVEALREMAERCSVLTYEFENVDLSAIRALESHVACHPNPDALETSQDRLVEKRFFQRLGIATAPFCVVETAADLERELAKLNGAGIVKTRRFGYDGKGQVRVSSSKRSSLVEAERVLVDAPSILEGMVSFVAEISIISARGMDGSIRHYEPAENVHRDGILRISSVPSGAGREVVRLAEEIAEKVLTALGYIGVIGIEFFMLEDGTLVANEFAPRVHNSGHWTEAACAISQFEQHIRAVAGLPLGNPERHSDCVMENLIGDDVNQVPEVLNQDHTVLHLYGKAEVREGRKMGHFTRIVPKKVEYGR